MIRLSHPLICSIIIWSRPCRINSIFSTTLQVTCRLQYLSKVWIRLYNIALNNLKRDINWNFQPSFKLKLNWKFCFQNNWQDKYPSSHPPGLFKICSPGILSRNDFHQLALKRLCHFHYCRVSFPSFNNKCGIWGITKLLVKKEQAGHPFGRVSPKPSQIQRPLTGP